MIKLIGIILKNKILIKMIKKIKTQIFIKNFRKVLKIKNKKLTNKKIKMNNKIILIIIKIKKKIKEKITKNKGISKDIKK